MAPGARSKFSAPMFEPEVFRKQMYSTEESACDMLETLRRPPQSFRRPVNCAPPLVAPLAVHLAINNFSLFNSFIYFGHKSF